MIKHYLDLVHHYLELHPYMGVFFAFFIGFGESLPVVGTILPGSITMSIVGVIAGRGAIPMSSVFIWASIGALLGDMLGFWLGKHYHEHLKTMWPFKRYPQLFMKGEAFFRKHGGKSIVVGRFFGPMRSSVPLLAGILRLSWLRFLLAAIPSAFLWALMYLLPGIVIGAISLALPPGIMTRFLLIGFVLIVFLWLLFWVMQRSFSFLAAQINGWVDRCWEWLCHHRSYRLITLITNQNRPTDHHQLTMMMLAVLSFVLFILLLLIVVTLGPNTPFNEPVYYFLQSIRFVREDQFFVAITLLGNKLVLLAIVMLFSAICAAQRQWRACWHVIGLFILTALLIYGFKLMVDSPRPEGLFGLEAASFPSGHTALSLSVFGFIAFLTAQALSRKWHVVPYTVFGIFIFLIALSRLYLGAHWFEDVLGGLCLGFAVLLLTIVSYRRCSHNIYWHWMSFLALVLAVLLSWALWTYTYFDQEAHQYKRVWGIYRISFGQWWKNSRQCLPVYQSDRFGQPVQPFNLQWEGNLEHIKTVLLQQGWILIPKYSLKNALGQFAAPADRRAIRLIPFLYREKPAALSMIKYDQNHKGKVELRLWRSGVMLKTEAPMRPVRPIGSPIWIGSIAYIPISEHHTLPFHHNDGIRFVIAPVMAILKQLPMSPWIWKIVMIPVKKHPDKVKDLVWDGKILMISHVAGV